MELRAGRNLNRDTNRECAKYLAGVLPSHQEETGISLSLGAQASDVLKIFVGRGIVLTALGIIAGLAAATGLTRLMASLLFGIGPVDALTFTAIVVLLSFVALLACWIPARRRQESPGNRTEV